MPPGSSFIDRGWHWFQVRAHGPHAVFWLVLTSFLEPIFLPVLPEVVMGAMILAGSQYWKRYAFLTTAATTLGATAGYVIGAYFFEIFGEAIISFYGLTQWFDTVRNLVDTNIFLVMAVISFVPIPNKVVVLLAGFLYLPFIPFIVGFFIGRLLLFGAVAYFVHRFGERIIALINKYLRWFALGALIFFAALLTQWLLSHGL